MSGIRKLLYADGGAVDPGFYYDVIPGETRQATQPTGNLSGLPAGLGQALLGGATARNPDGSPAGTGGFAALPSNYFPTYGDDALVGPDPYLNGTNVGPSPGYVTNNPKIYNSGIVPGAYTRETPPSDIGNYVDYLNQKFQQVNTYGRGAGAGGGGGGGGTIPWVKPGDIPNTGGTGPSGVGGGANILGILGGGASAAKFLKDHPELLAKIKDTLGIGAYGLGTDKFSPELENRITAAKGELDPTASAQKTMEDMTLDDWLGDTSGTAVGSAASALTPPPVPGGSVSIDMGGGQYYDPVSGTFKIRPVETQTSPVSDTGTNVARTPDTTLAPEGFDFSGFSPAGSADSALAYSLNQPISGAVSSALPTYSGLTDFGGLSAAQSADAALEAALTSTAGTPLTSIGTEFAPVGDVNSLLNQTPNINIDSGFTPSLMKPFESNLANTGASIGAGLLGQHIWGGGDGAAGAMVNALGATLGPVGAFLAPLVGNVMFHDELPPLRNPITGQDVPQGSPEYSALEEFYGRNVNVPTAINTYNYSPEDQARLADAFYNPTDNTAANVSNITQNSTGLTYDPMSMADLASKLGIEDTWTVKGSAAGGRISGYAQGGGIGSLPVTQYAAGGKFLRGDGDGMSDSIPAVIQGEEPQQAALADGEFVVPADVVSHLGNGSSEAGSRKLYEMMDKVRVARTGRERQAPEINPDKFLPG